MELHKKKKLEMGHGGWTIRARFARKRARFPDLKSVRRTSVTALHRCVADARAGRNAGFVSGHLAKTKTILESTDRGVDRANCAWDLSSNGRLTVAA